MTYDQGVAYCAARGASLAAIYNANELSYAQTLIRSAGIIKAITAARADGSGWTWHGTDRWMADGFPLNTGQVIDQASGTGIYIYSLTHYTRPGALVWDADGHGESFPVLCRRDENLPSLISTSPATSSPPPSPLPAVAAPSQFCRARGYQWVGCGECPPTSTCAGGWGSSSANDCCGTQGGYCGSEWSSSNPNQWISVGSCTGIDFIRVSPGCSIEVATSANRHASSHCPVSRLHCLGCLWNALKHRVRRLPALVLATQWYHAVS